MGLGDFWLGDTVAPNAAVGTKPPDGGIGFSR
jgi:hypothetical protein